MERRTVVAGAGAGLAAILAGCLADDETESKYEGPVARQLAAIPDRPATVRADADTRAEFDQLGPGVVVYADIPALREDPLVEEVGRAYDISGPISTVFEALGTLGTALAPQHDSAAVEAMVTLGNLNNAIIQPTTLYWADWDVSELLAGIEQRRPIDGFREERHVDVPLYYPENRQGYAPGVADLDGERIIVGPPTALPTMIDAVHGETDPLGDPYRSDLLEGTGLLRVSARLEGIFLNQVAQHFDIDADRLAAVERIAAAYDIDDDLRTVSLAFHIDESEDIDGLYDELLNLTERADDTSPQEDAGFHALADASIDRKDATLWMDYESTVADLEVLIGSDAQ